MAPARVIHASVSQRGGARRRYGSNGAMRCRAASTFAGGRQLEQVSTGAPAAILQQPDRSVRALFHLADPGSHVEALGFPGGFTVEFDAYQRLGGQATDQAAALPVRERVAVIDHEAGR